MTISGYASSSSALPGGTVPLHLSANPPGLFQLTRQRLGVDAVATGWGISIWVDTQTDHSTDGWLGYNWPVTVGTGYLDPGMAGGWPSGVYRIAESSGTFICDLAVRAAAPGTSSKRLLLADFITQEAYNLHGGNSLYSAGVPKVSFNRPPYGGWDYDKRMLEWMYNSANSFPPEVASSIDLHAIPTLLDPYDCVIIAGHAEYWSKEMFDRLEAFVAKGGNLISLSGNTCFRQVRFEDANRTLVCYKNSLSDPEPNLDTQTVAFAQPPVHRPQNRLLGVGWAHGGFNGLGQPGSAFTIHFPAHWVFAGVTGGVTGATPGYEVDAAPFTMEPTPTPYPRVLREGDTPLSTVVLASSDLTTWTGKPGVATMALGTRGGMVFSGGSIEWLQYLADPALNQITKNVFTRLTTRRVFDWEQLGATNGVVAMAAVEDRLFCVSGNALWVRHPVLAYADWRQVGAATNIVHLAGAKGALYALDSSNQLFYWRPLIEPPTWTAIGSGPAGVGGVTNAIGGLGAMLYATDATGTMYCRPASTATASWFAVRNIPQMSTLTKLCSYNGTLWGTISDRLVRSNFDSVEESTAWIDVLPCSYSAGIGLVEQMLFLATTQNLLWWLDLRHPTMDIKA